MGKGIFMLPELGHTFPCKSSVSNEKRERDGEKKQEKFTQQAVQGTGLD